LIRSRRDFVNECQAVETIDWTAIEALMR